MGKLKSKNFITNISVYQFKDILQLIRSDILRFNGKLMGERRIFRPLTEEDESLLHDRYTRYTNDDIGFYNRVKFLDKSTMVISTGNNNVVINIFGYEYTGNDIPFPICRNPVYCDKAIFAGEDIFIDCIIERYDNRSTRYTKNMFNMLRELFEYFFNKREAEAFALLGTAYCSDVKGLPYELNDILHYVYHYSGPLNQRASHLDSVLLETVSRIWDDMNSGTIHSGIYHEYLEKY